MSESNGDVTRNRLSQRLSESTATTLERPERNGRQVGSTQQKLSRERHTALPLRLRWKTGRVLMGVAAAAVLVAGLGFALNANSESAAENPTRPRVLAVQTVYLEPVTSYQAAREYTGAIVARRTSQLGFESPGKLEEIYVDEGDSVTAGSALAQLDTEHLETRRRQLVARRAIASGT